MLINYSDLRYAVVEPSKHNLTARGLVYGK